LLASVYLLFGLHIAHWRLAGRTLAPLELNELMYTLELGIVTAGFLFMAVAFLGTLVFGRFFCSWACHILALQDLCGWLLKKIGIRPRPVRSRVLLIVPFFALFDMFVLPQILRVWRGETLPVLHLATDREGWASFLTTDFWRNLPSPGVALATFAVCGFAIVYVLGSRAFCTYGCPYGALFNLIDRFAPGRIARVGECKDCGHCTAACTSGVRVHDELDRHGMVVNPGCLKDLDCVAACPNGAVGFAFRKPPGLRSFGSMKRERLAWDYTLGEEALMLAVCALTIAVTRGLYETIPFLMSLGLGCIAAFGLVHALRLLRVRDLRFVPFQLKRAGKLRAGGIAFLVLALLGALLLGHSAWIRWDEARGLAALAAAEHAPAADAAGRAQALEQAAAHLERRAQFGLVGTGTLERARARTAELAGDLPRAQQLLAAEHERSGGEFQTTFQLARVLAAGGRLEDAARLLQSIVDVPIAPGRTMDRSSEVAADAAVVLGNILAEAGEFARAERSLRRALDLRPGRPDALYALGVLLCASGRAAEGRALFQRAVDAGARDADLCNNLGRLLLDAGELAPARVQLEHALEIDPAHAAAHYNFGLLLERMGEDGKAREHLARAGELDPRFAQSGH
jgi:tetratricopeptide (TPR) repeat protein/ferredoxin